MGCSEHEPAAHRIRERREDDGVCREAEQLRGRRRHAVATQAKREQVERQSQQFDQHEAPGLDLYVAALRAKRKGSIAEELLFWQG